MRIALAQINATVGDLKGNARKIEDLTFKAREKGADVVVFPELAVCGYPPEDLLLKDHFIKDNIRILHDLAKGVSGITALVGFVDTDEQKNLYNTAAVIHEGAIKGVYHKMELPNYGVFDEKRYFKPGQRNAVFKVHKTTIGISICEDIWQDLGPCNDQVKAGARILLNLSASPYHAGKSREREEMLKGRALDNKTYVCYVNLVGGQDELVFDGGSYAINPQGKVIASGKQFEEDLVFVDIDTKGQKKKTVLRNVKETLISENSDILPKEPLAPQIAARLSETEAVYRALVLGTGDYIKKNGFKKVVMGLSGGIDSSLTAVIACDAIGRDNVIGVSMPSQFTSSGTKSDARKLAMNLNIKFVEIPIDDIFSHYLVALQQEFSGTKSGLAEENLQARIRGNILMALSNKFGWLVLTTGNKSEIATGYCTLYGDMAGGFAVIKDVPKTMVYEISRFRNKRAKAELIPETVFTRPPTAELRENQKDEDSLPPYGVLDPIIKDYVELDKSLSELNKHHDTKIVKDVLRLIDNSEYKRRQAPPGVKITPRAFGRDRRLPITNRYKEY